MKIRKGTLISAHHNLNKLVVAQGPVSVFIRCIDDGHDLVLGQLVPDMSHEMFELLRVDGPAPVLVEGPEGQPHHLLVIIVAHLG